MECETLLQNLIDSGSQTAEKGLFEDYLQRLSTWAAYLGVFARPSQCLDHRLSNAIDIQDLVLRGLDSLGRSLTSGLSIDFRAGWPGADCLSIVSQNKYQSASTDADEGQVSLSGIEEELLEIEDTLEQLYRLATAIKSSSRKTIEQRASEFAQKVELKPINKLFIRTIECLYPQIDQSLQDRLSTSMSDRFAKIMFLGTRQATLAARHNEQHYSPAISEDRQNSVLPKPNLGALQEPRLSYSPSVQTRDQSLAPLTSLSPSKFWPHLNNLGPSILNRNKTTSVSIHRSSYPLPPKPQRQELRLCEWCGEPLKSLDMDPAHWRKHVDNDLRPYICLAEDCTNAVGYPSFRQWSSHMQQHDEFWYRTVYSPVKYVCPLCVNTMSSFEHRVELFQHVTSMHESDAFDSRQLSLIANQSQGIRERPVDECPLCGLAVERESQKEDVPSKRESDSWSEGSRKKLKAGQQQPIPAATSSNDQENQSHETNNHESMALHIASHLQTLMFLTLRVISMQRDMGSEDEDVVGSNIGTDDFHDHQDEQHVNDPLSFEDDSPQLENSWLPAAEVHSFEFGPLQRTVFKYPMLRCEDILDTSIEFPDSSTIQEIIIRLEALLSTTKQNLDFYAWSEVALESVRNQNLSWPSDYRRSGTSGGSGSTFGWQCCNCKNPGQSFSIDMHCVICSMPLCDNCTFYTNS
ncbi:uncharacterized protein FMAN_00048 [Fusarium mangiferae]|uniref:C2H2-type domain-containing protein n=1 Tax=Fusarium mangiferae TaxID=192010 RepID=A0A1L7U052_FUSMA|nr:uncharacterized protein FMAN_00048 [Fusarium mangiferae]CVL02542.1 uncharacterized protein FMAN_00048 [Fusarium mangiferae]